MIPVYRHPRKDEHIYGWLHDLSKMNGMVFRQFMDAYMSGMAWDGTIDSVSGMNRLEGLEDLRELVYNNTLLPALAPYMEQCQQAVSVDRLLNGGQKHVFYSTTYLKVCPACIGQDTARGIKPYYRVWHQLREITRCAVHKLPLLRLRKRGPIDEITLLSAEPETGDCGDIAEKVYSLYRYPAVTDCSKWHCKMTKQQRRISRGMRIESSVLDWIRDAERTRLLAEIPCAICGGTYLTHPYAEGRYNICLACRERLGVAGTEEAILKIRRDYTVEDGKIVHLTCGRMLCRYSPQAFLWSGRECGCKAKKGSLKIYKKAFDDEEFTVTEYLREGEKTGRRIKIRHSVCGGEFVIRPPDFTNRRYCRICHKREYGRSFMDSLCAMTGDEYEVLTPESDITATTSHVTLRHKVCGTTYSNVAKNILIGQRCPFCVSKPGADKVAGIFNECFALDDGCRVEAERGYIRITFPDGSSRRERGAMLVQEMTRQDEPELFPGRRIKRMEPEAFFSSKAKLFLHYREHCEDGVFRVSCQEARDLGMTISEYWSGLVYLEEQGKIEKTGVRAVYRFTKKE